MPKRKLKPVRSLGGLKKAKPIKRKTSALARPKPMTGKKFTSKLSAAWPNLGSAKRKTVTKRPPILKPPKPSVKPPSGGGGKPRPPRRKRKPRY